MGQIVQDYCLEVEDLAVEHCYHLKFGLGHSLLQQVAMELVREWRT
jgi:hypothetical protein